MGSGCCRGTPWDTIPETRTSPTLKVSLILISFITLVIIPSITVGVYLAFIASDQYTAEMRFAVRPAEPDQTSERGGSSGGGSTMEIGGAALAGQDAQIVASYIRSRTVTMTFPRKSISGRSTGARRPISGQGFRQTPRRKTSKNIGPKWS